jgi:isoleucyl-tRNA synthetase
MTKSYPEPLNGSLTSIEERMLGEWTANGLLSKVLERMKGGEPLVFCEGPPTAISKPHMGHALTRAVKDSLLRYHIMNGRRIVPYIAGWDCHGLPVEIEVERILGLRDRRGIESYGVGRFNAACRANVVRYRAEWERMSRRVGYCLDYENAYLTMSNEYIESVWWSLKELRAKGLLVRENQVVPYCPRCGTSLSTHEVALGFRETEDRVVVFKAPMVGSDEVLLAYADSPWTLVGNALMAVNEAWTYLVVQKGDEKFIVSEQRAVETVPGAKVLRSMKGSELVGRRYSPPFETGASPAFPNTIVHSSEVPGNEGTGVMPVSPAHGMVDHAIALAEGVPVKDLTDDDGRFAGPVHGLAGMSARDSTIEIIRSLEERGLLHRWGLVKHSYPHCWRCDTALIYKSRDAWFVRTSKARTRMLELNDQIDWVPSSFKDVNFGNFLGEAKDWAVSRTRYWGTPLPVWRCECGNESCIGSIDEMRALSVAPLPEPLDLHRPMIDQVVLRCPVCSRAMRRVEDVLDCWYDSGCAPFAQYHYPFENVEAFDGRRSVDLVSETVDQTRGWFYTQHAIATLLFDEPAFRSVLVMGNVVGEDGKRMRPESGNVVYPEDMFGSVGADAARLYMLGSPVWQGLRFSAEDARRTMVGTLIRLLNVYSFFSSNANSYGYSGQHARGRTHDLDMWIVSRLNTTVAECRAGFDSREIHRSVRAVESFTEDLSNWYVRRSRRRFWVESDPEDRFSAHATLCECLLTLSKAMAPITPFFSDWLYRSLGGPAESVHLDDYPAVDADAVNHSLEHQMGVVRGAVEAGWLARHKADVKLRQPLEEAVIAAGPDEVWILRRYERMIAEELNVKHLDCTEDRDRMVGYAVAPNLKSLGPKLKESASEVSKLLEKVDGNELARHLRGKGRVRLGGYDLTEGDVIVTERSPEGFSHANVGDIHVYIKLDVSQKLRLEGLSREVIRRIQHMRKSQGLRFEDPVSVEYSGHHDIESAVSAHREHIMHETHADTMEKTPPSEGSQHWSINGTPLDLKVTRR